MKQPKLAIATLVFCVVAIGVGVIWVLPGFGNNFGHFEGQVVAKWRDDGRTMELIKDFAYIAPQGKLWRAHRGSIVDGASIPQALWSMIGGPFEGKYRNASVVHDVACDEMTQPWTEVHLMFYNACRCGGVNERTAKIMYAGVYLWGPRWEYLATAAPDQTKRPRPIRKQPPAPSEENVRKLQQYIQQTNPSLEDIRKLQM